MDRAWRLQGGDDQVGAAEKLEVPHKIKPAASSARKEETGSKEKIFGRVSYGGALVILWILSLPIVNPWVHGDGVGYYAYIHSVLINHNLVFDREWEAGNESFVMSRLQSNGEVLPNQYTETHHIDNHFSVGPSILWAPFLGATHLTIITLNRFGLHLHADGFSLPYLLTMALATAGYSFLGLWLSFCLARSYVPERWAFLATVAYWFASSLFVYMYLNPAWSHALSFFAVALFLWYWHRTRDHRTAIQWIVWGLLAALMVNLYYLNVILLLVPALEGVGEYIALVRSGGTSVRRTSFAHPLGAHALFVAAFLVGVLPTLVTRKIIYGHFFTTGYPEAHDWNWTHPVVASVLFSSDHGLLVWTPILALAIVGLFLFRSLDSIFALYLGAVTLVFIYVISSYVNWDGISSFGNRFFVSLGAVFIIGLAAFFDRLRRWIPGERKAFLISSFAVICFVTWNVGFVFQWGDHLIPVRGPISWRAMTYNQFHVVPARIWNTAEGYFFSRMRLLREIENKDMQQLRQAPPDNQNK
ncbi:MAG TPA: hypothetical protein VGZ48_10460 [Candidatus Acidoferrales bacterium]|jgi:hypothetical protein|nr:hypothetical protein [Candidatus Acidoferrales bacterium]